MIVSKNYSALFRHLSASEGEMRGDEIARATGLPVTSVRRALRQWLKRGLLKRRRDLTLDWYRWAPAARAKKYLALLGEYAGAQAGRDHDSQPRRADHGQASTAAVLRALGTALIEAADRIEKS